MLCIFICRKDMGCGQSQEFVLVPVDDDDLDMSAKPAPCAAPEPTTKCKNGMCTANACAGIVKFNDLYDRAQECFSLCKKYDDMTIPFHYHSAMDTFLENHLFWAEHWSHYTTCDPDVDCAELCRVVMLRRLKTTIRLFRLNSCGPVPVSMALNSAEHLKALLKPSQTTTRIAAPDKNRDDQLLSSLKCAPPAPTVVPDTPKNDDDDNPSGGGSEPMLLLANNASVGHKQALPQK